MEKKLSGKFAEQRACEYLIQQGMTLVQQNYYSPFGEIDLILKDQNDIVFVEVRSRGREDYGAAKETITYAKRKKLIKTGLHFLQKHQWLYKVNSRFDVVALQFTKNQMELEWIKNAFWAEY